MHVRKLMLAAAMSISCQLQFAGFDNGKIAWFDNGKAAWADSGKPYTGSPEAYNAFNQGRTLLINGDAAHAAGYFKRAIELDPNFGVAESNYGVSLSALGDKRGAIEHLKKATTIEPGTAMFWDNLAVGYQAEGDLDSAAQVYEHYLQISPGAADRAKVQAWLNNYHKGRIKGTENATTPDYAASIRPPWMRWNFNQMPLKVFIGSGVGVPGFQPAFVDLIPTACNDWSRPMQGKLSFVPVDNPNNADITIEWTHDLSRAKDPGEGGHTQTWGEQGRLAHVQMIILTNDPTTTVRMTPQRMSWILHHEIGHALGLSGHSPDPDDAMYYNVPPTAMVRYATLTNRDLNTLAKYYGLSN